MKTFYNWIEETHPDTLDEGLRSMLMAGGLTAASLLGGAGCQKTPPTPPPAKVQASEPSTPESRAKAWELRMSRKSAQRQKGTPKELPNVSVSAD